jgi:predicted RNase H-like HicB family nuclease
MGQCLEIPQARGQGNTKTEAIKDTKKAIKICIIDSLKLKL